MIDWTSIINGFIATLPATLGAIGALILSVKNGRKIEEVHKATNGMSERLNAVTRESALQEGHTAGVADEKARANEK